jgi:hypothetical protein
MILFLIALFILISFCVLFHKYLESFQYQIFILLGILLIMVAGLRPEGTDFDYAGYMGILNGKGIYKNFIIEPSFHLIKYIINNFLHGKTVYLFLIYALLGVSFKLIAIKEITELLFLTLLVYLSGFFMLHEMTQIRAGVASGILLLCIKPLYERKLRTFLLLCFFASLFHYSSLIFILFWFLNPISLNLKFFFALIPISYLLHFIGFSPSFYALNFPIEKIQQKLSIYLTIRKSTLAYEAHVFNVVQLFRIATTYILGFYAARIIVINKYFYLILKIYIIALCISVLFADVPAVGARLSELLLIVEILLIPMMYYIFKPKILAQIVIIAIALGFMCLAIFHTKLIQ